MSVFLITAQFVKWLNDISFSLARLTAIITNRIVVALNKTSAMWWSVKPSKERLKNSLGNATSSVAAIMCVN